jgi:sigma-B regulation protein RsbU (phosphoserine phosphatase)
MLKNSDKILLVIGIIGAIIFFWGYPIQNPESAVKLPLDSQQIIQKSKNYLQNNGFSTASLESEVKLKRNTKLLDSLNEKFGRIDVSNILRENGLKQLPAYYWEVDWITKNSSSNSGVHIITSTDNRDESMVLAPEGTLYAVNLTVDGKVWRMEQPKEKKHPDKIVDRLALDYALKNDNSTDIPRQDNPPGFLNSYNDTTIIDHLYFSFFSYSKNVSNADSQVDSSKITIDQFVDALNRKRNIGIDKVTTADIARYHLLNTPWSNLNFKVDTVFSVPGTDGIVARVRFSNIDTVYGQSIHPQVDVTASGGLVGLKTTFNSPSKQRINWREIAGHLASVVLFILLFIVFAVVFIRRIDARLFDSRAAILMGVLGWFLATSNILMDSLHPFPTLHEFATFMFYLKIFVVPVIFGLFGAFAMFFASGTTESIARNVLPSKIESLNLARRGYFLNKDMGTVFIRSIAFSLILSGILTLTLFVFPNAHLYSSESGSMGTIFLADRSFIPLISELSKNLYFGLLTSFFIFLGISSYAYEFKSSGWAIILVSTIFGAFMSLVPVNPAFNIAWILGGIIGFLLGYIYWRYDFLTAVLSGVFLFMLWETSSGWLLPNSPDFITSLLTWILMAGVLILGIWGIYSNKSGDEIPKYVPRYVEEITQKQRMERELEIARTIQSTFLPRHFPQIEGIEIAADCHSALEVGGDYYDIIDLGNGRLGVAIADVSGKGVHAAFYMTLLKGFLQSLCHQIESPAELLCHINKLFYDNAERGTFISMIYGILDTNKRTFTFARAGHNPLLLKSSANNQAESLKPDGLALGMTSDGLYSEYIKNVTINLSSGNLLMLYTDGYTEAMNNSNHLYGEKRLIESLEKLSVESPKSILYGITEEVNKFVNGAKQHDDMTMIVIKLI